MKNISRRTAISLTGAGLVAAIPATAQTIPAVEDSKTLEEQAEHHAVALADTLQEMHGGKWHYHINAEHRFALINKS